ncbi:MAG: tetratricopeptide repeat protein [Bdellovibrionales bacterium]|nr:tetratricopeptide repeat protein [Bdellovibrionales bacterium]
MLLVWVAANVLACSSLSRIESAFYKNSALSNMNPAPQSMTPPEIQDENGPIVDTVYMRSQADYHFTMGEAYSLEGRSEKAIEEFKLTLVYDPASAMVRMRLAAEYIRQGLLSEAIEQTEAAVEAEPENIDAKMLLGGLYSSLKMYDMALKQYKLILKQSPDNTDAPIFIGAILAEKNQLSDAIVYFKALAENKKYKEPQKAWYYVGRIHLEKNQKDSAEYAKKAYLKAIQIDPSFSEAVLALATLYETEGQKKKSVKLLESYQEKFGPNKEVAKQLSRTYLEDQKYDEAFSQLEIIEGYERSNLNVKLQMALIMIEQKRYQEAAIRLEDIMVEAPESDKIRYYLGAVYEELKEDDEAVKNFKRVPSSSPYYPEAVILAANIVKKKSGSQPAAEMVKEAIGYRDDIPQFYAFYAALLDELKEYSQAVKMLNAAVARFPSHAQLRFFLGSMHDRLGEKEETIENMK